MAGSYPGTGVRRSGTFLGLLCVAGLVGVASLALAPLELTLPEGVEVSRAALLIQPALLVVAMAALGWVAAPRTGLDAPILGVLADGGDWRRTLRATLGPALLAGALSAAVMLVYGLLADSQLSGITPDFAVPLVSRVLYGGLSEELLLRWGVMGGLAWLLLRFGRPLGLAGDRALWVANAWAALLFGLGHLPTLYGLLPDAPSWLVLLVVGANALIGVVLGWLFMRRGLEAAMIAHGLAHVIALTLAPLL
jgi:Type II CAAX prenyl endopeptidase Rce1-like